MSTFAIIGHSFIKRDLQVPRGAKRETVAVQQARLLPDHQIIEQFGGYSIYPSSKSNDRRKLMNTVPVGCRAVYFVIGDNDLLKKPTRALFEDMVAFGHEVILHRPSLQYVGFSHLFARVERVPTDAKMKGSQRSQLTVHNQRAAEYNRLATDYSLQQPRSPIQFFGSSLAAKASFLDNPMVTKVLGHPALDVLGIDGLHPKLPESRYPEPWVTQDSYTQLYNSLYGKQRRKKLAKKVKATYSLRDDGESYRCMLVTPFYSFCKFVIAQEVAAS